MARPFVGGRLLGIVYHRSFDRTTWILLRLQDEMDARQFPAQRLEPALFIVDKPVNSTNFAAQRDSPNRLTRAVASSLWNDEDTPSSTLRRCSLVALAPSSSFTYISHIHVYLFAVLICIFQVIFTKHVRQEAANHDGQREACCIEDCRDKVPSTNRL